MRTNVLLRTPVASTPILMTHEGARAATISPVDQLRRSVMSCMLFEDEFYEDGQSIATRIHQHVADVLRLSNGADIVANIAYEARTKFKLRHAPLWLIVALVQARTPAARAVVSGALAACIQRPDELAEFVAQYWKATTDAQGHSKGSGQFHLAENKKMLPAQVKKGLAAALAKFDEYSLSKYANRDGDVKLRDVLFLSHAKPATPEQAALWKKLAAGELTAPDTWEVNLSAGADKKATFERLMAEDQLGALALLRNLRNMQQAGVPDAAIKAGLDSMKTERVLPFRFITAARYAPSLESSLEAAMFRSLADQPKLLGRTILCIDTSGSMGFQVSGKSEITRRDAAAALAMLLREICDDCQVLAFGDNAGFVRPRRGFALNDEIGSGKFGHGTNVGLACSMAAQKGYDRCIVITDEQSATPIGQPANGARGYFINVASARNGIGYGPWLHLDGWSEAILDYIREFEAAE